MQGNTTCLRSEHKNNNKLKEHIISEPRPPPGWVLAHLVKFRDIIILSGWQNRRLVSHSSGRQETTRRLTEKLFFY
jgi:hypothetical protein